jgi:hypothetical protein
MQQMTFEDAQGPLTRRKFDIILESEPVSREIKPCARIECLEELLTKGTLAFIPR